MMIDTRDRRTTQILVATQEAERCLSIMSDPIAMGRPMLAWQYLLLGNGVEATIAKLAEEPIELGTEHKYDLHLRILTKRHDLARAAWDRRVAELKEGAHVRH